MLSLRPADAYLRRLVLIALTTAVSVPALASDITVASPSSGVHLTSPVWIRAHNIGCEGVPPTAFGYSIDNSSTLIRGKTAYDIDITGVFLSAGTHTVHFKSWTARGLCPVVNTQIIVAGPYASSSFVASTSSSPSLVTEAGVGSSRVPSAPHTSPVRASASIPAAPPPPPPSSAYGIPANALSFGDLDANPGWSQSHDRGTPGTSRGSTVYPASTPLYDDARQFYMTYTKRAGERWNLNMGNDAAATHFVLDTYIYLPDPSQVMNLELDINQVLANGKTVIFATQCAGIDNAWEAAYTSGKKDHWLKSNIKCDPRTWTANTWHHIQIAVYRDANGVVTHDWVVLDGVYNTWNFTRLCANYLGWQRATVNVQYQIEGNNRSSGAITSYLHELTILRW